jgi:sodium/hydrogen exchanger 8
MAFFHSVGESLAAAPRALAPVRIHMAVLCMLWGFIFAGAENPTTANATTEAVEDAAEAQHIFDAVTVLVVCGCLLIALACGYALHKFKFNYLPHSTAAMLLGVVVGGMTLAIQDPNATADVNELDTLQFSAEFFFYVLLPPIIFDAGYHFEKKRFFRNFSTITLFAVLGTIISTFVVGFVLFAFAKAGIIQNLDDQSPLEALLFGSLISATDPVATLSIMGNPELKCVHLMTPWRTRRTRSCVQKLCG